MKKPTGIARGANASFEERDLRLGQTASARKLAGMGFKPRAPRKRRADMDRYDDRHLWMLSLLRSFVAKHGCDALRKATVVAPGAPLGTWAARVRRQGREGDLRQWLFEELERVPGWTWHKRSLMEGHEANIALLRRFVASKAVTVTPDDIRDLGWWIHYRRQAQRTGVLPPKLAAALEKIPGWTWRQRDNARSKR